MRADTVEVTPPRPSERAFTLIELLVVMIIIAILMAVAIPTFLSQKSQSKRSKATQNIKVVVNAIETCAIKNTDGSYAGCVEHNQLWAMEPGLKSIKRLGSDGAVPATPNGMDIDGILDNGTVVHVPLRSQNLVGFIIATWMYDGDIKVWFIEAHTPDGRVIKSCGPGDSDVGSATSGPHPGSPVPGSRMCTTGSW